MGWLTPSEIVIDGFADSRVVMMNEGHHGWSRCIRTREVGRSVLPAAHDAGCRHLAMEALPNWGPGPEFITSSPQPVGFLAQPDMAAIVDTAMKLGWTLVAYEVAWDQTPPEHQAQSLTWEATNHRELAQAANLVEALNRMGPAESLMVWCGNGHHSREPAERWVPMGARFIELSGLDPFCIDQLATVALAADATPRVELTTELSETLTAFGGTAGFTRHDPPADFEVPSWYDAMVLSTDNRIVGEVR